VSDNRANIKVSRDFYNEHNPKREELGLTWEEYIEGQSPELESTIRRVLQEELNCEQTD